MRRQMKIIDGAITFNVINGYAFSRLIEKIITLKYLCFMHKWSSMKLLSYYMHQIFEYVRAASNYDVFSIPFNNSVTFDLKVLFNIIIEGINNTQCKYIIGQIFSKYLFFH